MVCSCHRVFLVLWLFVRPLETTHSCVCACRFNLSTVEAPWISALTAGWKKEHSRPMHVFVWYSAQGEGTSAPLFASQVRSAPSPPRMV
jgi:hypothetical protein